jgi:hypothetical protein
MMQGWDNFYLMTGTSAGALIGLMFVVLTLGTSLSIPLSRGAKGVDAFMTPTLVHFGGVLFQAMVALVPWGSKWPGAILFGLCGLVGLTYAVSVGRRIAKLDFVSLQRGDWLTYAVAPAFANLALLTGSAGLMADQPLAPFAIAASVALLLVIGIRDAWDLTLWIAKNGNPPDRAEK